MTTPLTSLYLISALLLLFGLKFLPSLKFRFLGPVFFISFVFFSLIISGIENKIYENSNNLIAIGIGLFIGGIIPLSKNKHSYASFTLAHFIIFFNFCALSCFFYYNEFYLFILSLIFIFSPFRRYMFFFIPITKEKRIPPIILYPFLNIFLGLFFMVLGLIYVKPFLTLTSTLFCTLSLCYLQLLKKNLNFSIIEYFRELPVTRHLFCKKRKVRKLLAKDTYYLLEHAQNILIVPGYGFALCQAQSVLKELVKILEERQAHVYFVVHPLAGRMYGHMNVLLSEINISDDKIIEISDMKKLMPKLDVCLALGANDIINPLPQINKDHPLWGMDNLHLDRIKNVFIFNKSLEQGYAKVENPLYYAKNSKMILGDAKDTLQELVSQF